MGKNQFVRLDYDLIDSAAWQRLKGSERYAYIQLKRCRYRRNGNGQTINTGEEIEFGHSDCPSLASATFVQAIEGLRIAGFIQLIKPGSFQPRRKATYILVDKWRTYAFNN